MIESPERENLGFRESRRSPPSSATSLTSKRYFRSPIVSVSPFKGCEMCSVRQYAGASLAGYHPTNSNKRNQDSLIMAEDIETGSLLFVCLDGHGVHGDRVSQEDIKSAIRQVLFDLERNLSAAEGQCGEFSGTTLSMAVIRGSTLVIANVGDSRIVIAKHTADNDNLIDMRRRLRTDSLSTGGSFDSVASGAGADTDVEALSLSISDISTRSTKEDGDKTSNNNCNSSNGNGNGNNMLIDSGCDGIRATPSTLQKTSSTSLASCCDEDSTVEPGHISLTNSCNSSRSRKRSRSNLSLSAEGLTIDHKPDLLHEYSRITSAGGRVFSVRYADGVVGPPRVWLGQANVPGLAMSRSIGDFVVHTAGVVSTPDISEMELDSDCDCMLIVATDGLWDQVSNSEAVNIAAHYSEAHEAVEALIDTARGRWLEREKNMDDITVCVVYLQGF